MLGFHSISEAPFSSLVEEAEVVKSLKLPVEIVSSIETILASRKMPVELIGSLVESRKIPVESLLEILSTLNLPIEFLTKLLVTRKIPVEYLADLIEKYQPQYLYILDDSFLYRPNHELDAFIEMYAEFKIPFWFNTRPESVNADYLNQFIEIKF